MASAEKLLHEAQFAFQSISFGESISNTRNRMKATSLSKKIIRRYPASMEASEAHAILRRLGEEAYTSKMELQHRHVSQDQHHRPRTTTRTPERQRTFIDPDQIETLDWTGLVGWLFAIPKLALFAILFGGFYLFGLFGPFLFLPLIAFVLFTGPFRQMLKQEQRDSLNALVKRINALVANRHR
jgi:hypothetical protein